MRVHFEDHDGGDVYVDHHKHQQEGPEREK